MAHNNTVFAQLLKLVSRHEFEALANQHHTGRKLRKMTRWSQFLAMATAQLSSRSSLRDVVSNLSAQASKLYHLGAVIVSRSSLARVNEQQPYTLYEQLAGKLLTQCQARAPRHGFRFKNKLYSLDASTIDLCLSVFPWARFRTTKGAVKLHMGLDHEGMLPSFLTITDGKTHDITAARALQLPKGSIVVMDRGYTDYAWYNQLNTQDIFFVTRLRKNARYRVTERRSVIKSKGLTRKAPRETRGFCIQPPSTVKTLWLPRESGYYISLGRAASSTPKTVFYRLSFVGCEDAFSVAGNRLSFANIQINPSEINRVASLRSGRVNCSTRS